MSKQVRKTVLLCCEGKSDQLFIVHLKTTYTAGRPSAPRVKAKPAGGKGSNNVISTLLGEARCSQPDKLVALLDGDFPPSVAKKREADRKRVQCIVLMPCLEGLFLKILGHSVPSTSQECKDRLRRIDNRDPFAPGFYSQHFPKALLDHARNNVDELDQLLMLFDD
jgi:hypothetical protein